MHPFPAEVQQSENLPLISALRWSVSILLAIYLGPQFCISELSVRGFSVLNGPEHGTDMLSHVPQHQKAGCASWRKYMCSVSLVQA